MLIPEYENYQENKQHGKLAFPFDIYLCTIPQDFQNVPLHWHEEMEIVYIKKGSGTVSVNLTDFTVSAGSIVFVPPGQLHSICTEKNSRMEYENIIFSPNILQSKQMDICASEFLLPLFSGRISIPVCMDCNSEHYDEIASVLNVFDRIGKEKPEGMEFYIKSQLFYLFYLLKSRCVLSSPAILNPKGLERMKAVVKYVELHYAQPISIEQISKIAACAPSHFMRSFRKIFGVSFMVYLNDYRLTMGARLLTETSATILDVAANVGFDNLSYFNRCFKKKYLVTPGQYRKTEKVK